MIAGVGVRNLTRNGYDDVLRALENRLASAAALDAAFHSDAHRSAPHGDAACPVRTAVGADRRKPPGDLRADAALRRSRPAAGKSLSGPLARCGRKSSRN